MTERRYPVHGDVDIANAAALQEKLMVLVHATDDDLVVDCDDLEFIDSSGIAAFAYVQRLLDIQGRAFRLANLTGTPRRAVETLGLLDTFEVAESEPA
jgi:anti-sigma B factor antagonist